MPNDVILSGYVVSDADAGWMEGMGGVISPQMVRDALAAIDGPATIRLNSDGGDPFAGEAIRSTLAQHPGGVTVIVEGIAASAASLLFMGAKTRCMSKGSILMIHDPSTMAWGTEAELMKQAAVTGHLADTYASVYGAAAGISTEEARAVMRAETWFSAQEAIDRRSRAHVLPEDDAEHGRDDRPQRFGLDARRCRHRWRFPGRDGQCRGGRNAE